MEDTVNNSGIDTTDPEFKKFAWPRIIAALALAIAVLWAVSWLTDALKLTGRTSPQVAQTAKESHVSSTAGAQSHEGTAAEDGTGHAADSTQSEAAGDTSHAPAASSEKAAAEDDHAPEAAHGAAPESAEQAPTTPGVRFVNALIKPINHEVNERFWGWRPNDILNFTDNVNEMQLGTLELTRRTTVALTEKISRAGSASALNPHLENAMNGFMISARSYWMPSAESKYNEAIKDLKKYRQQLVNGQASFYTRSDSLIPLLQTLEELLGSCDENLVKQKEDNGEPVSTFQADNYFYYAKGVAHSMTVILKAVDKEFAKLLEVRGARDIMHHAIESAHHAAQIEPWIMVTEASLNGILANHRANMAAHISHTRYYLGVMIKTLST
ncbi:MAG: DUF2333 family protein [Thermodesulfobacteriota bacterium]